MLLIVNVSAPDTHKIMGAERERESEKNLL